MVFLSSRKVSTQMQLWAAGTRMAESKARGGGLQASVLLPNEVSCLDAGITLFPSSGTAPSGPPHLATPSFAFRSGLLRHTFPNTVYSILLTPSAPQSSLEPRHPELCLPHEKGSARVCSNTESTLTWVYSKVHRLGQRSHSILFF